jgi:hypothetical protein
MPVNPVKLLSRVSRQQSVALGLTMIHFSEDFVGGFFDFGRTYGASARFACDSAEGLEADWPVALAATAKWRQGRKEKATALHLFFQVPVTRLWDAVAFIKGKVIVPPESLARELRGLYLRVYVLTPEMEHYVYAELFPEATGKQGLTNG